MTNQLGTKIKQLRKEKGFTLDQLSKQAGISKSYLWEIENQPKSPAAKIVEKIATNLGVTSSYLLGGSDSVSVEVEDQAFFNQYKSLNTLQKQQLWDIMKILNKEKRA